MHRCTYICTWTCPRAPHLCAYVHTRVSGLHTHVHICAPEHTHAHVYHTYVRAYPPPQAWARTCVQVHSRQAWFAHRGMCKHTRYMWTSEAECTHTSVHYTRSSTPNPCSWWRRTEWQIPPALKNLGGVRNKPLRCMKVMLCFSQFPGRCEVLPVSFKLGQTETSGVSWTRQPGLAGFLVLGLLCLGCMASPCLYG